MDPIKQEVEYDRLHCCTDGKRLMAPSSGRTLILIVPWLKGRTGRPLSGRSAVQSPLELGLSVVVALWKTHTSPPVSVTLMHECERKFGGWICL